MRNVVTRRKYKSGFGKIPTTLVRRRISTLSRSNLLVVQVTKQPPLLAAAWL